jgi:NAD(P)H-nitrite reductase large subunit
VLIVGNGVAGTRCALTLRERDDDVRIVLISDETDYFFSRTALMYAFMDRLERRDMEPYERKVYDKQRIERVRGRVTDLDANAKTVQIDRKTTLAYDQLVLATGSVPRALVVPNQAEIKAGLVHFVTQQHLDACEQLAPSTREAVVVGGGLIGVELVECLLWHKIKTTFVVRENWYWPAALCKEEGELIGEHLRAQGVNLVLEEQIKDVMTDAQGRVASVVLTSGKSVPCQMLGVAIGVEPQVKWLLDCKTPPKINRGVVTDDRLRASLAAVWAAGDCAEVPSGEGDKTLVEPIWYAAKRHGEFVGRQLSGANERHVLPRFFNSAKFFHLEYTTVGDWRTIAKGAQSLLLRPQKGGHVSVRIVHHNDKMVAFNAIGSRWDHDLLSRWMDEERPLAWVRRNLEKAQFDVEFGRISLKHMTETQLEPRP